VRQSQRCSNITDEELWNRLGLSLSVYRGPPEGGHYGTLWADRATDEMNNVATTQIDAPRSS
jgi:hypothetical protein